MDFSLLTVVYLLGLRWTRRIYARLKFLVYVRKKSRLDIVRQFSIVSAHQRK